jgi:hypothetical protein
VSGSIGVYFSELLKSSEVQKYKYQNSGLINPGLAPTHLRTTGPRTITKKYQIKYITIIRKFVGLMAIAQRKIEE